MSEIPPPGQTAPAKIDANFELFGGAISYTDAKWTFRVTGNVTWAGGEFKPRVDVGNDGIADIWHILGSLTVTNTNTPKIVPITENYVPAQGLPVTLRRTILTAENGITGTPTLQNQNPTYQLYSVEGPGNQRTWKLGPPN